MTKIKKLTLLFLLLLAYIPVAGIEMGLGILKLPFSWLEKIIINKANTINTK
jgi:phosphotransferase system  glucose/maltose/N-acetylglucosamine-specific IIC component